MKTIFISILVVITLMFTACSTGSKVSQVTSSAANTHTRTDAVTTTTPLNTTPSNALPKAVIYKMNGDYAKYVPIVLSRNGKQVQSYPAPTDLTSSSSPLAIGDGWYLDRRGSIGPNTAFTTFTYDQYRALSAAPSPADLLNHILAGAKVTEIKVTPIQLSEALADPSLLNQYK